MPDAIHPKEHFSVFNSSDDSPIKRVTSDLLRDEAFVKLQHDSPGLKQFVDSSRKLHESLNVQSPLEALTYLSFTMAGRSKLALGLTLSAAGAGLYSYCRFLNASREIADAERRIDKDRFAPLIEAKNKEIAAAGWMNFSRIPALGSAALGNSLPVTRYATPVLAAVHFSNLFFQSKWAKDVNRSFETRLNGMLDEEVAQIQIEKRISRIHANPAAVPSQDKSEELQFPARKLIKPPALEKFQEPKVWFFPPAVVNTHTFR